MDSLTYSTQGVQQAKFSADTNGHFATQTFGQKFCNANLGIFFTSTLLLARATLNLS